MNTKEIIPTKDELDLIKRIRKEEENYQKMMRTPPKVYTHTNIRKTMIRI